MENILSAFICVYLWFSSSLFVLIHRPPQILPAGLRKHIRSVGWIHRDVMLEAMIANVGEKLLQARDFGDSAMTEGFELVVCGLAFAYVSANHAGGVVGRETCIGERPGRRAAFHGAVGILHAQRAAED